jgi:hypothetical protein
MRSGLPEEYYTQLHACRREVLGVGLFFTAIVGSTGYGAIFGSIPLVVPTGAGAFALFYLLAVLGDLKGLGIGRRCCASIIPFFQREVGEPNTFRSGKAIARHWCLLNSVALEGGAEPLSAFGSCSDSRTALSEWYLPKVALTTIATLLNNISRYRIEIEEYEQLQAELNLLKEKLEAARRQDILFCFHLKTYECVYGQVEEQRKGTYF